MMPYEWRPIGLVVLRRRAGEIDMVAGAVRARIVSTPRRVVVELSSISALAARSAGH